MKVANCNARQMVNALEVFKANNTFAENEGPLYVVYSYGRHFPMYVYNRNSQTWIKNSDKYSVTTSKHMSQCHPSGDIKESMDTDALRSYISKLS